MTALLLAAIRPRVGTRKSTSAGSSSVSQAFTSCRLPKTRHLPWASSTPAVLTGIAGVGIQPVDVTAPAFVLFAAGHGAMPGDWTSHLVSGTVVTGTFVTPALECGHSYFWRVRVLDETTRDAVVSPWSEVRGFTIKAGFRVTTPYFGPQLLAPDNGCGCACNAPMAFSWSPFKETTEYQFTLSENADMSSPLVSTAVKTTAYQYHRHGKVQQDLLLARHGQQTSSE